MPTTISTVRFVLRGNPPLVTEANVQLAQSYRRQAREEKLPSVHSTNDKNLRHTSNRFSIADLMSSSRRFGRLPDV
ncbi:hypothetical protein BDN72DRAFT_833858 [Pluteus cervinus]|uniref:Uncharacterized protein n=1 Tax=Pluteus cervinus TaxID=181527 RepID=A0ACD3B7N3_9AGAR|nr:hypothetical protein BDN72DRAFT_833858 [Pluteus cervinus]